MFSFNGSRLKERLDLRAPEDRFATDEEVRERHILPADVPEIEGTISQFFRAWVDGDQSVARSAADTIVNRTRAYFESQGVPSFAHPILPPQFTNGVVKALRSLPAGERASEFDSLVHTFANELRTGVAQELRSAPSTVGLAAARPGSGSSSNTVQRAPTWVREPTFWERMQQRRPPSVPPNQPPPPVVERTWDQEYRERSQTGARERARQEAYDNAWNMFGFPLSPEEKLRRDLIADVRRRGDRPIFLSGKDPHPDDPYKDRVAWPTNANPGDQEVVVTGPFGRRTFVNDRGQVVNDFHPGTDFRNQKDEPVFSPKNGTILRIVPNAGGAGDMVYVLHDDGSISAFFHTQSLEGMQEGDEVYAGQRVGISNGSGAGPPHTHYSYFPPGTPIDPQTGLPMRGRDDHDRGAPARTQTDAFGPDGPYGRPSQQRPPFRIKR
jgi:murein DD-endopeptidase MepM/ murein hydrolase activator NlpD